MEGMDRGWPRLFPGALTLRRSGTIVRVAMEPESNSSSVLEIGLDLGKQKLEELLTWIVEVDPDELSEDVRGFGACDPRDSFALEERAHLAFSQLRWKATAVGAVAGMPGTVATMIPVALVEAGLFYRTQVKAAGRVALVYEPEFFSEPDAGWELLVPIFGARSVSDFLREVGVPPGEAPARSVIREHLSVETLSTLKRVMLRRFGIRVAQKMVITKTVPFVGAIIGGGWNYAEATLVRNRVVGYFAGRDLGSSS
jgi:hypothetical protein